MGQDQIKVIQSSALRSCSPSVECMWRSVYSETLQKHIHLIHSAKKKIVSSCLLLNILRCLTRCFTCIMTLKYLSQRPSQHFWRPRQTLMVMRGAYANFHTKRLRPRGADSQHTAPSPTVCSLVDTTATFPDQCLAYSFPPSPNLQSATSTSLHKTFLRTLAASQIDCSLYSSATNTMFMPSSID